MTLQIDLEGIDPNEIAGPLRESGIAYEVSHSRGFDGIAVATVVISAVSAVGSILTPIIMKLLEDRVTGEISINGITLRGLKANQIKEILNEFVRHRQSDDGDREKDSRSS